MIVEKFLSETLDKDTFITICKNEKNEVELRVLKHDKLITIVSDVILIYHGNVYAKIKEWIQVSKA